MNDRPDSPCEPDARLWRDRAARAAARSRADRRAGFQRAVAGVHAISAMVMMGSAAGALLGSIAARWPSWYIGMIVVASILPIVSAVSAWFWKDPPLYLPIAASASVILPLALARFYASPVMWLNVLALAAVAYKGARTYSK